MSITTAWTRSPSPGTLGRSAFRTLAEAGSTIIQQLAKNVYFTQEKRMARKAGGDVCRAGHREALLQTGNFEMYVNTIYFRSGC